jgi:SAM-dependent methyltransferase
VMKNTEIKARMIKIYDRAVKKHGISSSSVLWDNPRRQYFRFFDLVEFLDINRRDLSLLDIGCGNCELWKFLNLRGFRGRYIGIDINSKLLDQAKRRFRDIEVYEKDILSDQINDQYDYVVMSGIFNVNVGQPKEWVYNFLKKAFSLCKEAMSFNMISSYVNYRDKSMYYIDPAVLASFCIQKLSKRIILSHYSLLYNSTVTVFKSEVGKKQGGVKRMRKLSDK